MFLISACMVTVLTLTHYVVVTWCQEAQSSSICQTMQYRMLSVQQQNEHQCMILEQLHQEVTTQKSLLKSQYHDLYTLISDFQANMYRNLASLSTPSRDSAKSMPNLNGIPLVRDCSELKMNGINLSGVYPIRLPNRKIVNVWCDMETSDGGWIVIQRRMDGSVNFARPWDDYAFGFGNPNSEYWLGNDNLYWLSTNKNYSIQFELWDWDDSHAYALYDFFRVENEQKNYQLTIQGYTGTAGDAMFPYHNKMLFSTIDRDNDEWHSSCAKKDQSGWWFKACGYASLNGAYIENGTTQISPDGVIKGILWSKWKGYGYSMKRTEIKIKPFAQIKYDRERNKKHDTSKDKHVTDESETVDHVAAPETIENTADVVTTAATVQNNVNVDEKTTDTNAKMSDTQASTQKTTTTTAEPSDYEDYDYYEDYV